MAVIQDIDDELAATAAEAARARELLADAVAAAGRIANGAAAAGFTGIARNMNRVAAAIEESHTRVAGLAVAVDVVRALLAQVPEQVSPRDTIAVLGPVAAHVENLNAAASAAIAAVGTVRTRVAAALQGGASGPMLSRLDAVSDVLTKVLHRCGQVERHVAAACAEAGQVGAAGNWSRASVYPYRGHRRPSNRRPSHLRTSRRSVGVCLCGSTVRIRRWESSTGNGSPVAGTGRRWPTFDRSNAVAGPTP